MTSAPPEIMIVEDNADDYEATMRRLRKNQVTNPLCWCQSGQEALDRLLEDGGRLPGLVLLDLNMPGLDGRQVLQRIKTNEKTQSIPVIVLTTSNDPVDVDRCYDIGANSYIQKPVNFHDLTEAIRAVTNYWFGVAILPSRDEKAA